MASLEIAKLGNPVLRKKAEAVHQGEIDTQAFQQFIDDLFETMVEAEGIGLAAPQVSRSQQVVVMVMMGLELMINGVILAAAGFWWFLAPSPDGQVLLLVVIAAMTVEMAMGFAVATLLHRTQETDMTDMAKELSE